MKTPTHVERTAIKDCIVRLSGLPLATAEFLTDLDNGDYKSWHEFKAALSRIKSKDATGRYAPIKNKPSGGGGAAMSLARQYTREQIGVKYYPRLNFSKCKTTADRIRVIRRADISPEIKADLLTAVF